MIIEGVLAISAYSRFNQLENYLKTTEEYLVKAKIDFQAQFDAQVKTLPPEEREEFAEYYFSGYGDYSETYPEILRSSFLVSTISLLEHEMWQISRWLKRKNLIQSHWNDIKGNFFERFKKCCKEARLPLSYGDPTWQEINNYYLLRNCIVHNGSFIQGCKEEKELRKYATRKNIVGESINFPEVRPKQQIVLTGQFNKEVIKTMWGFLSRVYKACEQQHADN